MELPCFILLKSNAHNKYLSYSKVTKGSNNHASLRFSDSDDAKGSKMAKLPESDNDDSLNSSKETTELQYLKFEVEKAKSVEGLVHIRTCYNNKYWVRKSEDSNLIVAEANEAEEDQSKWSSTISISNSDFPSSIFDCLIQSLARDFTWYQSSKDSDPALSLFMFLMANSQGSDVRDNSGVNMGSQAGNFVDSLFLSNSDQPGAQLISYAFDGTNYLSWTRGVKMALGAKLKMGFVDGTCAKPGDGTPIEGQRWMRADYMVRCWLLNSMVNTISESFMYVESAKQLWDELTEMYGHCNAPLIYQLRRRLSNVVIENLSVADYMNKA